MAVAVRPLCRPAVIALLACATTLSSSCGGCCWADECDVVSAAGCTHSCSGTTSVGTCAWLHSSRLHAKRACMARACQPLLFARPLSPVSLPSYKPGRLPPNSTSMQVSWEKRGHELERKIKDRDTRCSRCVKRVAIRTLMSSSWLDQDPTAAKREASEGKEQCTASARDRRGLPICLCLLALGFR